MLDLKSKGEEDNSKDDVLDGGDFNDKKKKGNSIRYGSGGSKLRRKVVERNRQKKGGYLCPTLKSIARFGIYAMGTLATWGICVYLIDPEAFYSIINVLKNGCVCLNTSNPFSNYPGLATWLVENQEHGICFANKLVESLSKAGSKDIVTNTIRLCTKDGLDCFEIVLKASGEACFRAISGFK